MEKMDDRQQKGFFENTPRYLHKNSKPNIMELAVYLKKPLVERKQIVKSPIKIQDPFWLERLKTAVSELNPFAVMFNQDLINEYWNLKQTS